MREKIKLNINRLFRISHYFFLIGMRVNTVNRKLDQIKIKFVFQSFREFSRSWQYARVNKDPEVIRWINEFIDNGDVVYDIGSNTGGYSLYCALKYQKSIVYSFDPNAANTAALNYNAHINSVANRVFGIPFAISSDSGLVSFLYRQPKSLFKAGYAESTVEKRSLSFRNHLNNITSSYKVLAASSRSIIEEFQLEYPNHIKIDVDGHENDVIKGLQTIIKNNKLKSILIEIDIKDCLIHEILQEAGFERHEFSDIVKAERSLPIENRLYIRNAV